MASLKDKDRPEQNRFLAPEGPNLDDENIVSKLGGNSGEEKTINSGEVSDLFVGGNLVTPVEQELGLSRGNRAARTNIYGKIDDLFYNGEELDTSLQQTLEAAVETDPDQSIRNISHQYSLSTSELVDYSEQLDQAGFIDYQDATMETNTMGEFAYHFIQEMENDQAS